MKLKSTTTNATGSVGATSRSKVTSALPPYPFYAICIESGDNSVSLQIGKAYKVIRPLKNDRDYHFRVIDEEGEDYLYPRKWFVPITLKPSQRRQLEAAMMAVAS